MEFTYSTSVAILRVSPHGKYAVSYSYLILHYA